jgi:hypothetical protein
MAGRMVFRTLRPRYLQQPSAKVAFVRSESAVLYLIERSTKQQRAADYLLQLIASTCFNIDDDRVPILLDDATYFGRRTWLGQNTGSLYARATRQRRDAPTPYYRYFVALDLRHNCCSPPPIFSCTPYETSCSFPFFYLLKADLYFWHYFINILFYFRNFSFHDSRNVLKYCVKV